MSLVPIL
jgi:hypothetical protein